MTEKLAQRAITRVLRFDGDFCERGCEALTRSQGAPWCLQHAKKLAEERPPDRRIQRCDGCREEHGA